MQIKTIATFLVVLVPVLMLAACMRDATDETSSNLPRYTGSAPLSINGVRLGETVAEMQARLGPPDKNEVNAKDVVTWRAEGLTIQLDASDRVTRAHGRKVMAAKEVLIHMGMSYAETAQVLGAGSVKKYYGPGGSGVISFSMSFRGQTVTHARDSGYFVLVFDKDKVLTGIYASTVAPH